MTNADTHPDRETRVLYNAACPICSAEIAHYADLARRSGAPLNFEAIGPDTLEAWGLDEESATRRLHVLRGQELRSGVDAFIAMWAALPRWRWLAWLVGLPGLRGLAHLGYEHVAAPLLYRAHRRRQARLAYEPRS
ncbi:MAG: DUF393 domain-containing protein [Rhodobacteraceae bacterium]|nr:DUF393 domain-containing protein [Paracoccaceae bacterium]